MLGRLLSSAIQDTTKIHVRDRAVFYYRLLQADVEKAAKIINSPKKAVDVFEDPSERKITKRLFEEFNTLSVLYRKPSELFVNEEIREGEESEEETEEQPTGDQLNEDQPQQIPEDTVNHPNLNQNHTGNVDITETPIDQNGINLNDDFLGLGDNSLLHAPTDKPSLILSSDPQCMAPQFQQLWKQLPLMSTVERRLKNTGSAQQIEGLLKAANFKTVASGTVESQMKLYLYTQEVSGELHLVEIVVNLAAGRCKATFKGQSDKIPQVSDLFLQILSALFV